jgi:uncharacterized protein YkwD
MRAVASRFIAFSIVAALLLGLVGLTPAAAAGTLKSAVPTISGTPRVGMKLTAAPGAWSPAPVTLKYQWLRAGAAISGATASTYTVAAADLSKAISVKVTGSKTGYTTAATSSKATAMVAAGSLVAPVPGISGTAKVGSKLTAVPGSWTAGTALKYQWLRAGAAISGATAVAYTPGTADIGAAITVRVTGTNPGYATVAKTSAATVPVVGILAAAVPWISGTAVVGSRLWVVSGAWSSGTLLSYQWLRSGVAIPGATVNYYDVAAADQGKAISVKVSGAKAYYDVASQVSSATALVAAGTLTTAVPAISGTTKVGGVLTGTPGTWGPAPVTVSYQWLRAGAVISGATASTYTLVAADQGKAISVRATGSKAGYATAATTSKATTAIAAGTLTAPVPAITGTPTMGSKLTAVPGAWTSGTTLTHQWLRSGAVISGATASSYTLAVADQGKALAVRVTGSKAGFTTASATSTSVVVVGTGVLTAPVPTISGAAKVGTKLTVGGTWGPAPVTLSYQWFRSGYAVAGATASSYTAGALDLGQTISVRVTGAKAGYSSVSASSKATAVVQAAPSKVSDPVNDAVVRDSFKLINDYRVSKKLKPLKWNPKLAVWSQTWADQLKLDVPKDSFTAANWHNPTFYTNYPAGWNGAGENVAFNTTAKTMFDWWVNSPDHNANMLNPNFTDFSFGYIYYTSGPYAGMYIGVQNFAKY